MSKRKRAKTRQPAEAPAPARRRFSPGSLVLLAVVVVAGTITSLVLFQRHARAPQTYTQRSPGSVTFNKDIAPIVFEHCAGCHRPGEAGPFDLLTYADVQKHAQQVSEVTQSRFMPPWLPEDGHQELLGQRRLTVEQIGLIRQWASDGAPEGKAADLPPLPKWTEGWQLGPPDLVVTMPGAYTLSADGKDVYRNFILPVPTKERRFVRAFEFRPSTKAIHHAFIRLDATRESRQLDERQPGPGFAGMSAPPSAFSPSGHFLGWQPGRGPSTVPEGLAWTLPPGVDIVLLLHLQPRGKPELVQPSIGLYFTDTPPTATPTKLGLRCFDIDIPAGATNYAVEKSVTLPVDVDLLALLPHAHYLGKRLEGLATLPDGTQTTLLVIPNWDFNWQSDYRFVKPVFLPKNTVLGLRYSYDNSANNPHNPSHPPVPVRYGLQSADEMGELHFQMLAHNPADGNRLADAAQRWMLQDIVELNQHRLRNDPTDADAVVEIAKTMMTTGDNAGAEKQLRRAVMLRPGSADAHYTLGIALMELGRDAEAEPEFLEACRLNPSDYMARNNAGLCNMHLGKLNQAVAYFREVLRLHPGDAVAQENLDLVERARRGSRKGK